MDRYVESHYVVGVVHRAAQMIGSRTWGEAVRDMRDFRLPKWRENQAQHN